MTSIEVVPYAARYRRSFELLNSVWIEKYFWMEDVDLNVLRNPEEEIIARGGMVFFAKAGSSIVGTGAVINHGNGLYEISKMAVDEDSQGKGIGRRIITRAIDWVKESSGKKIFIETNTVLETAVNLYKKLGFVLVQDTSGRSHYERTNLHLELEL
jgi:GNAT superfamily N-acetyltransferase